MKQIITIIVAVLIPLMPMAQNYSEKELINTLEKNIPIVLKESKVPGLALTVIHKGEIIITKGYGFSDVSGGEKVSTKTGFNIGSMSKMFTAWGIMKLVEEKKINLDSPVSNYISRWKLPSSEYNSKKVTIRNLLQHTAGLSVHGYNGYESKEELSSLTDCLLGKTNIEEEVKLIMEPESKWQYSGGGYTTLQLVIEEVSGLIFENFMKENIFKPLKMRQTSFTIGKQILKRSAKAYNEEAKEIPLRLFNAQAAAGLHTTIEDLIIFAKASFSNNTVLSIASIEQLITPTELSRGNYGMGYMVMNRFGNFTLTGHGGSNEGWQSGLLLDFESNSGIIQLTNGSSGKNVIFKNMNDWAKWYAAIVSTSK